jgi:hypothetical protein
MTQYDVIRGNWCYVEVFFLNVGNNVPIYATMLILVLCNTDFVMVEKWVSLYLLQNMGFYFYKVEKFNCTQPSVS